jgi:2-amino-4-hydroxy-6-hydroxymethyldihydropteridine diphosphokinase
LTKEYKGNLYFWAFYRMTGIYLLLGTNLGDRELHLANATALINQQIGLVVSRSSVYETDAWGMDAAPLFLNQVLLVNSLLPPLKALEVILSIENDLGRKRRDQWESRIIDIDMLYYGSQVLQLPELTVPHPRISQRRFALEPLVEIAPHLVHPVLMKSHLQLLKSCPDRLNVSKFSE